MGVSYTVFNEILNSKRPVTTECVTPCLSPCDLIIHIFSEKLFGTFEYYSYLCNQLQDKSKTMGREPNIKYKEISIQVEI